MPHKVEFLPSAAREFRKLPEDVRRRVGRTIDALAIEPRPDGVKKLSDGTYRVRVGDYRILYRVQDEILLIIVVRVRHRKEAYGP